ncbi:hypothetical protein [Sphingomonas sp.]|uniref:hypothetical protein n=1 Tax=Sphingomonas sp. TaxID=28214 RepID=UPI0026007FA2|nr:hypothetical protein [Sphingomonas sp.]
MINRWIELVAVVTPRVTPDAVAAAQATALASMTVARIAAIATVTGACAGLVGTIATLFGNRALERLRSELAERQALRKAKLDYEYEARKRLYEQCEPAVFRFIRECELARNRIVLIAALAREEQLITWLSNEDSRVSTIYRLFAPVATYNQISNTLTAYDLTLAPRIHAIFGLGRLLRDAFTSDQQLASRVTTSALKYEPNQIDGLGGADPAIHQHQGLNYEQLDTLTSAMIVDGALVPLPAFVKAYGELDSPVRKAANGVDHVVRYLDPVKLPVLWRVYVYNLLIISMITRLMYRSPEAADLNVDVILNEEDKKLVSWPKADIESVVSLGRSQIGRLAIELRINQNASVSRWRRKTNG